MQRSNWGAEDALGNVRRNADRAAREAKARQLDAAAQSAGRNKRRV